MDKNNVLFTFIIHNPFNKLILWKDKYKNAINITNYIFRCQFLYNYNTTNILCSLTNGSGITISPTTGSILINVSESITSGLRLYDSGIWSLEYQLPLKTEYNKLISGLWNVEASYFASF